MGELSKTTNSKSIVVLLVMLTWLWGIDPWHQVITRVILGSRAVFSQLLDEFFISWKRRYPLESVIRPLCNWPRRILDQTYQLRLLHTGAMCLADCHFGVWNQAKQPHQSSYRTCPVILMSYERGSTNVVSTSVNQRHVQPKETLRSRTRTLTT